MKLISIVLPTYNRAVFLGDAFNAIVNQRHSNWELIIVDDGSSDNTPAIVADFIAKTSQKVIYIQQENQGPAVARNKGIAEATGDYIAFYDSDDIWLPHHLQKCAEILGEHSEISWVYGACQRQVKATAEILQESTFYTNGQPNSLFSLQTRSLGDLHIIEDTGAALLQIEEGIDSGLQNSVLKREIFDAIAIPEFRIGEDRLFITMVLKHGFTLAFYDDIHVHYMVHDDNISDTNSQEENIQKRINITKQLIDCYEKTPEYITNLDAAELAAINEKLATEYFWIMGYALQWQNGFKKEALQSYKKAMKYRPFYWKFWKTYCSSWLKYRLFSLS